MAESRIKIKSTVNEINKHFKECPSKYFYIKYFNGEKNYKGNDDEKITFEVLIRHNEIGNRDIERKQAYTLETLEQTLAEKVKEYIKEEISIIEEKYMKLNNIDKEKDDNISRIINNCAFILDGIDKRNEKNNNQEKYPEWATEENLELIENWSYYHKELSNLSSSKKSNNVIYNNEKVCENDIDLDY